MALITLLTGTVIPWVAGEIFNAYKEKYITTGIKRLLFTPEEYTIRLNNVIYNTVKEYQKKYPPAGNFPFYHHKETFAQLSKYILFKHEGKNILESIDFSTIENIDKPTQEQVEHFYSFFVKEIQSDEKLKELYIEENYKEKIFDIYREISLIKNIIEDFVKTISKTDSLIKTWIEQIYNNLQKLKSSTALDEINKFEKEVLPKNQISNRNRAFIYFVKGLCLNENGKPQLAIDYFEQACVLDSENLSYKAWHLYLQYLFNKSEQVLSEVNAALKTNTFDPVLNSILTMEALDKNHVFIPTGISLTVQNSIRYKRIIYRYYLVKSMVEPALDYFETDKTDISNELKKVSVDNYSYLDFHFQLYFFRLLKKFPNNLFFQVNPELQQSPELQVCINYFSEFLKRIKDSEKKGLQVLYEYLLNISSFLKSPKRTYLDKAYSIFQQNKEVISPFYFNILKFGYCQIGEYQTTLNIFEEKENAPEEFYFKSVLYHKLGDNANQINSIKEYVQKIIRIDDQNIHITVNSILLPGLTMRDLASFYEKIITNSITTDGIYRDIILATKGLKDETYKVDSIKLLENNFKKICEAPVESIELINSYCRILQSYELWHGIVTVFSNKEVNTFESKTLLIEALWHSKSNSTKLLLLLEDLRQSTLPQLDMYYIWEINLNCLLGRWEKVEEISLRGKILFPKNYGFDYYLGVSYINQDKKEEYCGLIKKINLMQFRFQNFQMLIKGLAHFDDYNSAVEYTYNYVIANDEPQHRMFFFNLFIFNSEKINYSLPIFCEYGFFITIQSDTKTVVVNDKDNKDIYEKLIGKKVNESIKLKALMTDLDVEYKIVGIKHKYDELLGRIMQESETPELTGIPIQSFKFNEDDTIEDWNKQLMELFGKSGDERKIHVEKNINDYKNHKISLLQLTRAVFNDDILNAYYTVTNSSDPGYRIFFSSIFEKNGAIKTPKKTCLDLPAIILFSEAAKNLNIVFPQKFIISQHTLDYLKDLVLTLKNENKSKLTLNITTERVIPYLNQEKMEEQKMEILNSNLEWINKNCEIQTSNRKLDFMVQIQGKDTSINNLTLSYIDSMAIAIEQKAVFVSDEKIVFKALNRENLVMSSECYLKNCCQELSSEDLYDFLSAKNFIGIELPLSKAGEMTEVLIQKRKGYENILQNLAIKNAPNAKNIITLIAIIESILRKELLEQEKRVLIRNLFENLLEGIYTNQSMLQDIFDLISLSLFRFFYNNNEHYQLVTTELFAVLSNNNVKINVI